MADGTLAGDVAARPLVVRGGRALIGDALVPADVRIEGGRIAALETAAEYGDRVLDADDLLVLPGIVDLHGDAFERQIMPRPKVRFAYDLALMDTDRQLVANGITTAYHGLTLSWEPGLRSLDAGRDFVAALNANRPQLACDTRLHIRWETYALEALDAVLDWLGDEPGPVLAFNDHTTQSYGGRTSATKLQEWASRAGITQDDYATLLERVWARGGEVEAAKQQLAEAARRAAVAMLSHDDMTPEMRQSYRAMGCHVAEFPMSLETAEDARRAGEHIVLGAPNVVRGGSHNNALNAADAVEAGLCTVLASDYYYPALLQAAVRLVRERGLPFAGVWPLISRNPARAAGLDDRHAAAGIDLSHLPAAPAGRQRSGQDVGLDPVAVACRHGLAARHRDRAAVDVLPVLEAVLGDDGLPLRHQAQVLALEHGHPLVEVVDRGVAVGGLARAVDAHAALGLDPVDVVGIRAALAVEGAHHLGAHGDLAADHPEPRSQ